MGSGPDRNKKGNKKGNIKTLDQKPKEKEADFGVNEVAPETDPVKEVVCAEASCCKDDIKALIAIAEALKDHPGLCGSDPSLDICKKTLQRLIDRLRVIG